MTIPVLLLTTGGDPAATGGLDSNLLLNVGLFGLLGVVIIFMFRNSRKRRRDAEDLQAKLVPGADVMTQHGIFGTLISVDEEKNEAIIETTPGTKLRVHRQTVARVVDPNEGIIEEPVEDETPAASEPEFGEREEEVKPKRAPRKKPTE